MRILVTWGSKAGGTEGIGKTLAEALQREGHEVVALPAADVVDLRGVDAALVGGALYANRWHHDARRFVERHLAELRRVPVWFFSSGPLDDSADRDAIAPTREVRALMGRVGALGHATFGGRLEASAKGFPAEAMARTNAGDWRNPARIRAWATELSRALPSARPGAVIEPPGRSIGRLVAHGVVGWALCAAVMMSLLAAASTGVAFVIHAVAAPIIFAAVSSLYFRPEGAREPFVAALAFAGLVALLDAVVVAGLIQRSAAMFLSFAGFWLPLALIFAATWATGAIMSMMPAPGSAPARRPSAPPQAKHGHA